MKFIVDPSNAPLHRPGAYLIRNTVNGKCYIGISTDLARRAKEHGTGRGKAVLHSAIRKYGAHSFEFLPLLYSFDGTDWLPEIEANLIIAWNALVHGYNIQAASGAVGPYGDKFKEAIKASRATPEHRAKRSAATLAWLATEEGQEQSKERVRKMHSPEVRAYADERMRETTRTPEARASASVRIREIQSRPGFWEAHQAKRNATLAKPEVRARLSAIHKQRKLDGTIRDRWITNGTDTRRIRSDEAVPNGWRRGKAPRKQVEQPVLERTPLCDSND